MKSIMCKRYMLSAVLIVSLLLSSGCTALWSYGIYPVFNEGEIAFSEYRKAGYDFTNIKNVAVLVPFEEVKIIDFADAQGNVNILQQYLLRNNKLEVFWVRLIDGVEQNEIEKEVQSKGLPYVLKKLKVAKQADAMIIGSIQEVDPHALYFRGQVFTLTLSVKMFNSAGHLVWSAENTQRGGLHKVGGQVADRLAKSYVQLSKIK